MGDQTITLILSVLSLVAVCVPFLRGMRMCLQGRAMTRRMSKSELKAAMASTSASQAGEPMALLMLRVLQKSLRESGRDTSGEFIFDASRQYVMNEYEANYSRIISMYASLLPPIGFIGTTGGMLILFLGMHFSNGTMELGALAVALTSSIFALIAYSILEGMKIRIYGRLLECLADVHVMYREADTTRGADVVGMPNAGQEAAR